MDLRFTLRNNVYKNGFALIAVAKKASERVHQVYYMLDFQVNLLVAWPFFPAVKHWVSRVMSDSLFLFNGTGTKLHIHQNERIKVVFQGRLYKFFSFFLFFFFCCIRESYWFPIAHLHFVNLSGQYQRRV